MNAARAQSLPMSIKRGADVSLTAAGPRQFARRPINTSSHLRSITSTTSRLSSSPISFTSAFTHNYIRSTLQLPSKQTPTSYPSSIFRRLFTRSTRRRQTPPGTTNAGSKANESLSLSQRLKKLSREYGWSAVGVYLALSALDFPFCYLLVNSLGVERIGRYEEIIVSHISAIIPDSVKQKWHEWRASMKSAEKEYTGNQTVTDGVEMAGWGVEEAEAQNRKDASLGTRLALAYAIHKSFIFIRVPLTAAVTPKVVKVLRGWGWDIGKRTTKAAKEIKKAEVAAQKLAKKSN